MHKSHMTDVQRLSHLLIAACLAYIWIVYLVHMLKRSVETSHSS